MQTIKKFIKFLKPYRREMNWGVIFICASSLIVLPMPLWYRLIVDQALPAKNLSLLLACVAGIIASMAAAQLAGFLQICFFTRVREGAFADLRAQLYQRIQNMSLSFLGEQQTGGLLSRITSDVDAAQFLLARALVNDPVVLILDEGLSQVDPAVEAKLLSNLKQWTRTGKTVVMISHKIATLREADEVYLLKDGKTEKLTHLKFAAGADDNRIGGWFYG